MKVVKYRMRWSMTLNTGNLELQLEDGTMATLAADEPGKLIVWVDLLRNDAPVYYWKNKNGEGLASGWEQVLGMEDSQPNMDHQDGQA